MGYEKYGLRGVRLYMQVDSENTSQKKKSGHYLLLVLVL